MSAPQTVKQVSQFLELAGYFSKFIKHYANNKLMHKNVEWR